MRSLLKDYSSRLDFALRVVDPLLIVATGYIAHRIYLGDWDPPARYLTALAVAAFLGFAAFPAVGLYQSRRGTSFVDEIAGLFLAWLLIAVTGGAFLFLTKSGAEFSRGWVLIWIVGGFLVPMAAIAVMLTSALVRDPEERPPAGAVQELRRATTRLGEGMAMIPQDVESVPMPPSARHGGELELSGGMPVGAAQGCGGIL